MLGRSLFNGRSWTVASSGRTLREHGVHLVLVADGTRLSDWRRQLAELAGSADDEAADLGPAETSGP